MKNNVIFLHSTQNYSYQFSAANTKIEFIARGLVENGDKCIIHNGLSGCSKIKSSEYKSVDKVGIVITYPLKLNKLFNWFVNVPSLYRDLKRYYRKTDKNWVILTSPTLHLYLLYVFIARILGFKIVSISHEWLPTMRMSKIKLFLGIIYSNIFGYLSDGIFPISEYIIAKIQKFHKPYLKVPVLADFSNFVQREKKDFFLYCVYAAYTRVIYMIIDSFAVFCQNNHSENLVLVLSGTEEEKENVHKYIASKNLCNRVYIKSHIPYSELLLLYQEALALIIPLDPQSEQDKARFSQKIAEYVSSGTPIITNNVGEISYYFKNEENAIICNYSVDGFEKAYKWVCDNKTKSMIVGKNGFEVGKTFFDYKKIDKKISECLSQW